MIKDIYSLRLNNIVKVKESGKWVTAKVTAILSNFIIARNPYKQVGNTYDIDKKEVHGAHISDEWLCSFGWWKTGGQFGDTELMNKELEGSGIVLHSYNGTYCFYKGDVPVSREFKSLHELQNIFEDLTGKRAWISDMLKPMLASS